MGDMDETIDFGVDCEYLAKLNNEYDNLPKLELEAVNIVDEPLGEAVEEPVPEAVEEPLVEDVSEPVLEVVEEPVLEVVDEPVVEVVEEQVQEVVDEPVVEAVNEPVVEVVEEPVPHNNAEEHITISIEPVSEEPVPLDVSPENPSIPKMIFIVPYRNREQQLQTFKTHMKYILEDYDTADYSIYIIHQTDERIFNRGAIKNIGFLMVKDKYPNDYKNITLVFNDVDTMPVTKNLFHYDTTVGVVKHFFGFTYTLGGIVSIKAGDFERVNGFPNFWAWGYEDNMLQARIERAGIKIDRSIFYLSGDKNIMQKNDEIVREVNQSEYDRYLRNTPEGIQSIQNLDYSIVAIPELGTSVGIVNVKWFTTGANPAINQFRLHDLRQGARPYDTTFGLMFNNRRRSRGMRR
jgi:hypothetical protein